MIKSWNNMREDLIYSAGITMNISADVFDQVIDEDGFIKEGQEDLFLYAENLAMKSAIQKVALNFLDNMSQIGMMQDLDDEQLYEAVFADQNIENDTMKEFAIVPFYVEDATYNVLYSLNRFYKDANNKVYDSGMPVFPDSHIPSFKNLAYLMKHAYSNYSEDITYLCEQASMYELAFNAKVVENDEKSLPGLKKAHEIVMDSIVTDFFTNNDFGEVEQYILHNDSFLHSELKVWVKE